jgi:peptide chain release factor subunit 1
MCLPRGPRGQIHSWGARPERLLLRAKAGGAKTVIDHEKLEGLEAFDGQGAKVLTVYLDLDPERQVQRSARVALQDLLKAARERLEEPDRTELAREAAVVQPWMENEEPRGKGLALFSCASKGLWQAHFLSVPLKDHVAFEPRPDVVPLLQLFDEYQRFAVAVVDKRNARLFTVFLGEIEESEAFSDFVPGTHDQGGFSQARLQRHHEAHVQFHLKKVADGLAARWRRRRFDRLILAGPQEATTGLRRLLSRPLARLVAAVIPAEAGATEAEVLERVLEVGEQVEREVEERLLQELVEAEGFGRATRGIEPTLEALELGAVQTLFVAGGSHVAGSECPICGRLQTGEPANCPACGTAMQEVHDIFHAAQVRARDQAGSVEVVHGRAAQQLGELGSGMAALLRYPWPLAQPDAARETAKT